MFFLIYWVQQLQADSTSIPPTETLPDGLASLMSDAFVQLDNGELDAALDCFEQVIALNRQYIPALLGAAMVHADKNHSESAFKLYEQVVTLEPKHVMAWNGRGLAAFNLERMDEAVASFERSVEDQPVNGFFYESLAWAQMCANKPSSAIQSAKESLLMYSQTDASSIYPTLIIYFCSLQLDEVQNAQRALRYAVKNYDPKQWPAPVIDYLNDKIDRADLLSYVVNSAEETEAHVYIGLKMLHLNKHDQGRRHLLWAAEHGDAAVFEHGLAKSFTKRPIMQVKVN